MCGGNGQIEERKYVLKQQELIKPDEHIQRDFEYLQGKKKLTDVEQERLNYLNQHHKDHRSAHQIKYKIADVQTTVREFMPDAYDHLEQIYHSDAVETRTKTLHHARGKLFRDQGEEVLQLKIAGSGFQTPRMDYMGLRGKGKFTFDGNKEHELKEIEITKEMKKTLSQEEIAHIKSMNEDMKAFVAEQITKKHGKGFVRVKGKAREHVHAIKKEGKTKISMAGPLAAGGGLNNGEYRIEQLVKYMKEFGEKYLRPRFEQIERETDHSNIKPIHIQIDGHSRGAVASIEGAKRILEWAKKYSEDKTLHYDRLLKFDLIQYDPVPGTDGLGVYRTNVESFTGVKEEKRNEHGYMDALKELGETAETTVVYTIHSDHDSHFSPQYVKNTKRVILTATKHSVNLEKIDKSAEKQHRKPYIHAETGEVYRDSGLNELDEGVYFADEDNILIPVRDYDTAVKILNRLLRDTKGQEKRHETIRKVLQVKFGVDANALHQPNEQLDLSQVQREQVQQVNPIAAQPHDVMSRQAVAANRRIQDEQLPQTVQGIYAASRFFEQDTESKSDLFMAAETSVLALLEKVRSAQNPGDPNEYLVEFALARKAVADYCKKNSGWKGTDKGKRRRENMNMLLTAFQSAQMQGEQPVLSVKDVTIEAAYPYLGKDIRKEANKTTESFYKHLKNCGMEVYEDLTARAHAVDLKKAKKILKDGSAEEKLAMYYTLHSFKFDCDTARQSAGANLQLTKKTQDCFAMLERFQELFQNEQFLAKNHATFTKVKQGWNLSVNQKLIVEFDKQLKKLGTNRENTTREQLNIARLRLGETALGKTRLTLSSFMGTFFGTDHYDEYMSMEAVIRNHPMLRQDAQSMNLITGSFDMEGENYLTNHRTEQGNAALEELRRSKAALVNELKAKGCFA